jgi:hypothetical protein
MALHDHLGPLYASEPPSVSDSCWDASEAVCVRESSFSAFTCPECANKNVLRVIRDAWDVHSRDGMPHQPLHVPRSHKGDHMYTGNHLPVSCAMQCIITACVRR